MEFTSKVSGIRYRQTRIDEHGTIWGVRADLTSLTKIPFYPSEIIPTDEPQEAAMSEITATVPATVLNATLAKNEALGQQNVELQGEAADLRVRALAAEQRAETAEAQQRQARTDLQTFQERVRDGLAEAVNDEILDRDAVNNLLENLGLPLLSRTFLVTVQVKAVATQEVEVEVEAVDEDEVRRKVDGGELAEEIDDAVDSYSWEYDNHEHSVPDYYYGTVREA